MSTVERVAALYDIHGNVPALQAVLRDVEAAGVETIVFGGDLAWGPWPEEVLRTIDLLGDRALSIRGNADRAVAQGFEPGEVPPEVQAATRWCFETLDPARRDQLMGLPPSLVLEIEGLGETLFCHGSPRSDEESLTPGTPDARLQDILGGVTYPTVVCGHTHMQFDRRSGDTRVVNAGSVGMPYEGRRGAFWALLGPDVELRSTSYDIEAAAEAMRSSGCPEAHAMFGEPLLTPISREEATSVFEPEVIPDA